MQIHPPGLTEADVAERRRLGLDGRDEEWDGVYHVTASPSFSHQQVLTGLLRFLAALLEKRGGGTVVPEFNVFREGAAGRDFRVPDLVFVAAGREAIIAGDGIRGGAPDAVVEILSPRDETYAKFGFYAALGVPEILVVEPVSRSVEVWRLEGGSYARLAATADGWVESVRLEARLRTRGGERPRVEIADRRGEIGAMPV